MVWQWGGGDYATVSLADVHFHDVSRLVNADEFHTPHLEKAAFMGVSHMHTRSD